MSELYHHGIQGQKWGVKNGPPYPLSGGSYKKSNKRRHSKTRKKYSLTNKKHFDSMVNKSAKIQTLSYDRHRTEGTDMFYATITKRDNDYYNAFFNKKISDGSKSVYKFRIENRIREDIKIASEDSGCDAFLNLFSNNRDFYNFVMDPNRMEKTFVKDKYKFKGYREAKDGLLRFRNGDRSETNLRKVYRIYNYTIASDSKDSIAQRSKFFKVLKASGYSAVLDTNDAIYGGFKANSPIIVFDMSKIVYNGAKRVDEKSKKRSTYISIGRKMLGL